MKDKDFAVALALLIGIGFAGYAFIENQGRSHEAQQLELLRAQNEQLRQENTQILTRYSELQLEHQSFKDGVIYGK